ncbi:MAG: Hpt domain-containing protein [Gammaproteobacteria bacterium]
MREPIIVHIEPDIADLVPGFLANRQRDVESLRTLLEQGDFTAIRIIGHSMKGAGGGYGFDHITDLGAGIENAALDGDRRAIDMLTSELAEYLACVQPVTLDPDTAA